MWWSRAFAVLAILALGPVGCGFSPLYGKGGGGESDPSVAREMAAVRILPIKNRLGQQVRNALVQRITPQGEPGDYRYTLAIEVNEDAADLGYRRDSFATLGSLTLSASFSLTGGGAALGGGVSRTTIYFDYLGPRYASLAAERDAEERAIVQLADDLRSQIAARIASYKANPNDKRFRPIGADGELVPLGGRTRPAERP